MRLKLGLGLQHNVFAGEAGDVEEAVEYTLFDHATETPGTAVVDNDPVTLGLAFKVSRGGEVDGIYFWKTATDPATARDVGIFSIDTETLVIGGSSSGEAVGVAGWVKVNLDTPFTPTPGVYYQAGVHFPNDEYAANGARFLDPVIRGPITGAAQDTTGFLNGTFHYGPALAYGDGAFNNTNYWIDVNFVVVPLSGIEYTLFDHATETPGVSTGDNGQVSLGLAFKVSTDGAVDGIYFWKTAADLATSRHVGIYNASSGLLLASGGSAGEASGPGWVKILLDFPFTTTADVYYKAAVHFPLGEYPVEPGRFNDAVTRGPITGADGDADPFNGTFEYDTVIRYPGQHSGTPNYWIDVSFVVPD